MTITSWKNGRHKALFDENGELIAVFVYKKGAVNVQRIIEELRQQTDKKDRST